MTGGLGRVGSGALVLLVGQGTVAMGDVPCLHPSTYQLSHLKLGYAL